jgi:hypothetical protein
MIAIGEIYIVVAHFKIQYNLCKKEAEINRDLSLPDKFSGTKNKKVKISLLQAVEAPRVARGQGSHIT